MSVDSLPAGQTLRSESMLPQAWHRTACLRAGGPTMRRLVIKVVLAFAALSVFLVTGVRGHPGSGIVVDPQGQVFFQDSLGRAIWKIDAAGKLTKFNDKLGGHWMA